MGNPPSSAGPSAPTTRETVLVVIALAALVIALVAIFAQPAIEFTGHYSHTV